MTKITAISATSVAGGPVLVYGLGENNELYLFSIKHRGWKKVLEIETEPKPSEAEVEAAKELLARAEPNRVARRAAAATRR